MAFTRRRSSASGANQARLTKKAEADRAARAKELAEYEKKLEAATAQAADDNAKVLFSSGLCWRR